MKKPKKNATIDDLALMVAKGFEGVHEELRELNTGQEKINQRMHGLEEGQEQIKLKLIM